MSKFIDLTGRRFGRLTVVSRAETSKQGNIRWDCLCDCGRMTRVTGADLSRNHTTSCGCYHYHSERNQKLYAVFRSLKDRVLNPRNADYKYYGGRGITICNEWRNDYAIFEEWALSSGYQEGLSIDRVDNNAGYSPDNCRWVNHTEQCNNRRSNNIITFRGKTQTLTEWADEIGVKRYILTNRIIKYGWSVERALSTPVKNHKNNRL